MCIRDRYAVSFFLSLVCKAAVPLFYMVSGALLLGKNESFGELARKRILRIVAVIVIFSLLYYMKFAVRGQASVSPIRFLLGLPFDVAFLPYWYLYSYLGILVSLPFLRPLAQNMPKNAFWYLIALQIVTESLQITLCLLYTSADLEDALKKKMFSLKEFIAYFKGNLEDDEKAQLLIKDLERRLENVQDEESEMIAFQNWMDYARGWFMYCVTYSFSRNYKSIMNGEFQRELIQGTFHEKSMKIFKNAMVEFVYEQPEIVKLELSAKKIISTLLDDFIYAVIYMDETEEEYKNHQFQKKLCSLIPDNLKADYEKAKKMCIRDRFMWLSLVILWVEM